VAGLSGFLAGEAVSDPVTGVERSFGDVARRTVDLKNVLCASGPVVGGPLLSRVH
jgi:hypothetical protein